MIVRVAIQEGRHTEGRSVQVFDEQDYTRSWSSDGEDEHLIPNVAKCLGAVVVFQPLIGILNTVMFRASKVLNK